jgi:hypothetical protein
MSIPLVEWEEKNAKLLKSSVVPKEPVATRVIRILLSLLTLVGFVALIRLAS